MDAADLLWTARVVSVVHAIVVGVTMYGIVGVLLGRFTRSSLKRPFTWVFLAACLSQLLSYALLQECILTRWEKSLLYLAGSPKTYTGTFLQQYIPQLPYNVAHTGIPLIILAVLVALIAQLLFGRAKEG
jgi:hypothetical protein